MKTLETVLFCNRVGGDASRPGQVSRSISLIREPAAAPAKDAPVPENRPVIVNFVNPDLSTVAVFEAGKRYKLTFEEIADE